MLAEANPAIAQAERDVKTEPATITAEPAPATASILAPAPPVTGGAAVPMTMEMFLDRLMMAESGGRAEARNPRSTALGPFQFIESTFVSVAKRYFASETAGLGLQQVLALRTDVGFSRRAAEAYTRENAAVLKASEVEPSYPNLRLAFLLGPGGAIKVLKVPLDTPLSAVLGPAVLIANPFMVTMTARGLVARSAREVNQSPDSTHGVAVAPGALPSRAALGPSIAVACNLKLPSCKRWLSLQQAKLRGNKKGATVKVAARALQSGSNLARLGAIRTKSGRGR